MPASPADKLTNKAQVLFFAGPTFAFAAQDNEASSNSFSEGMIPKYKPATRMERFNYYTVKRGYKCVLYFNWPNCKHQIRDYSGAQFKGFQRKEEAENYLLA